MEDIKKEYPMIISFRPVRFPEVHEASIKVIHDDIERIYNYQSIGNSDEWKLISITQDKLCTN